MSTGSLIDVLIRVTTVEEGRYCLSFKAVVAPTIEYTQYVKVAPGALASDTVTHAIETVLGHWHSMFEAIKRGNHGQQNSD